MNILVKTASEHIIVRPDTTWEKDNESLYVPEFVNSLSWTPVLVARVCKPGRSVSAKFAGRYFNAVGLGALLYPDDLLDGSEEGFACASCLDHSSFIPMPDTNPGRDIELSFSPLYESAQDSSDASLQKLGKSAFRYPEEELEAAICSAIAQVTRYCYIRIGDLIAIELAERYPLCSRDLGRCKMEASLNGAQVLDFEVIF